MSEPEGDNLLRPTIRRTTAPIMRVLEICNKKGLHARASAKFVQTVEKFDADVKVTRGQRDRRRHLDHGPDDARRRPRHDHHGRSERTDRRPRSSTRWRRWSAARFTEEE